MRLPLLFAVFGRSTLTPAIKKILNSCVRCNCYGAGAALLEVPDTWELYVTWQVFGASGTRFSAEGSTGRSLLGLHFSPSAVTGRGIQRHFPRACEVPRWNHWVSCPVV